VEVVSKVIELRDQLADKNVAFVPTMGYLHEGHASLIRLAEETGLAVVVSIFVNPTQFNDPADLEAYPRDLERDLEIAEKAGCDIVFAPSFEEIYPAGDSTQVSVARVSELFEGIHRPGHFVGVATVVAKLFLMVQPNIAFFGEKDWQQCCVISRMVTDLAMPIDLRFGPTLRESDGLAMSSRNVRLSAEARAIAPKLYEELNNAATLLRLHHAISTVEKRSITKLQKYGFNVDYFNVVDANTMQPADKLQGDLRVVAAASIGGVRLIDNLAV
jgi:pantoate--beta-alanine ligase